MRKSEVLNHPALRDIWERRFLITIPEAYLRSEEEVRVRGSYTTGNADLDVAMYSNRARTYLTINEIFEHWSNGVDVGVVKYDDTEIIYNAIERHLSTWVNYLQTGLHLSQCPFNDLLNLDRFANTVYDKAKYVFTQEKIHSLKGAFTTLGIDLSPNAFFGRGRRVKYDHMYKTSKELELEKDINVIRYQNREGYQEGLVKVASRYDVSVNKPAQAAAENPATPLSSPLKFANE